MDSFKQFYQLDLNSNLENQSKQVADLLTEQYISSIFENQQKGKITNEYVGLELNDINENLTTLKTQIRLLERIGLKDQTPCLTVGETKIPIDIFNYLDDREKATSLSQDYYDEFDYRHSFMDERLFRLVAGIKNSTNNYVTIQSLEFVKSNVKKALSSFIEMRHASFFNQGITNKISSFFRRNGGSPPNLSGVSNSKYLTVKVNTNNHGLDIEASPAYFVKWKKFGSPTSPIEGYLIPGTYIFAGSGIGLPTFTTDLTPVDIPPNLDITITKF